MDNVATTIMRGVVPRDHTAHRRAYLDTYARTRLGGTEVAPITRVEAESSTVAVAPMPSVQLDVVPEPTQNYMQIQPSSDAFVSVPVATPAQPRKTYLDTLTDRHYKAVNAASQAEDTVLAPQLDTEIEQLFDDTTAKERDQRFEANLRALYSGSLTEQIAKNPASASASHVRTIVMSALACGVMAVGMFTFMSRYESVPVVAQPIASPVIEVESSNVSQPGGNAVMQSNPMVIDPLQPVKLVISSIGVSSSVEALGTTPEGLIAVPKSYAVAGWYNKSSTPGKAGPSVLVGHYTGGRNGIFDNLKNLNNGDLITTTNAKGQSFTYRVVAKNEYEKDKVPMTEIFKKGNESRLEIITCAGKWQASTYNSRLVVTATLVR